MGSPLSPIVAYLVMQDLEENIINNLNVPILYYCYVDDITLSAPENEIQNILERFNGYHHRLKFTCETEVNRSLNFLDITLIIVNNKIITDIDDDTFVTYHKTCVKFTDSPILVSKKIHPWTNTCHFTLTTLSIIRWAPYIIW